MNRQLILSVESSVLSPSEMKYSNSPKPGKMKVLRDLGYFSDDEIEGTTARKLSEHIFSRFRIPGRDLCILTVRSADGSKSSTLTAMGDRDHTAMSLLTGLPAVSVSKLIFPDHQITIGQINSYKRR